jgi:2-keto-4-pentenoate hydratase/2-oxohepta-3-ene-1,7-dioic acid hydratase in catechol pathway
VRLATLADGRVAVVRDGSILALDPELGDMRALAAAGCDGPDRVRAWIAGQVAGDWRPLDDIDLGPAIPDPGAIYTIGLNYRAADGPDPDRPPRPLVYGKLPTSVAGHGATHTWDRSLTPHVDAECELGVVIGAPASRVDAASALDHVFGYTIIDDVSSRDEWLDGDQWLLGKSMAGFCPVGPWVVTTDEVVPDRLRLGCTINGIAIQDGITAQMRFSIAEVIAYLSQHVDLRPGDLIATGTPARLDGALGPDRHLEAGDTVTCWIDGIGELTSHIA